MRRFLFVVHYPVFGGPHNRGLQLAAPLAEFGWQTVILLPNEPGNAVSRFRGGGVEAVTIPLHRVRISRDVRLHLALAAGFIADVHRIRQVIRRERIELVVIGGLVNTQAAIAARLEGTPLIWQIIDTRLPMPVRRIIIPVVRGLADAVMTTGKTVAEAHPGLADLQERLVPFFSPVDTDRFAPNAAGRSAARAELGLPDHCVVVGTVGNLNPQKGHQTFVRAAALLRHDFPDVRFVILGERHDTHRAYADGLVRLAESLGLRIPRDLVITGPGDRVAELAQAFDIFWLTSEPLSEGVPTVIMEAMSLAKPVVAADVGGVREIVADGRTGAVVPPRDPRALAANTSPLVADPDARERLGSAARSFAVARCDTRVSLERHLTAFDMATARRALKTNQSRHSGD